MALINPHTFTKEISVHRGVTILPGSLHCAVSHYLVEDAPRKSGARTLLGERDPLMGIPELETAPELYYNEEEAAKYSQSTRIIRVQQAMAERCLELSGKEAGFALDVGCGTGISGRVLAESGFAWVGVDVSYDMLRLCTENCVHADVGDGIPFQPGTFDLVVSVSCVQWLFYSYKSSHVPLRRIRRFFSGLFAVLREDGVCVLQFYCNKKQTEILKREAVHAGFDGNLVVDSPNTKNEKQFLVIRCGHLERRTEKRSRKKRCRRT